MTSQLRKVAAVVFALSLLMTGCFKSKTKVFKLRTADVNSLNPNERAKLLGELKKRDGALYRLPRTVILATVPVKKTTKEAGAFEKFAPCFFSKGEADDRTTVDKTTAFAIQRATFSSTGEPDPDETYVVLTRGGYFESKSLMMDYTSDLRLKKGEAESKNEALEFISKAAKTGIGIAARAAAVAMLADRPPDEATLKSARHATALRAKQCYDLLKSYQSEFYKEAVDGLAEADQALKDADAELASAVTPAQKQLAQQKKDKADKKRKAAAANEKEAKRLKIRAASDAAEMPKAISEDEQRGAPAGTTNGGGAGGPQSTGSDSSRLLNACSLSNDGRLAKAIITGGASTPADAADDQVMQVLAARIPKEPLDALGRAVTEDLGVKQALLGALNEALSRGAPLYTHAELPNVTLDQEAQSLLQSNPQGERLLQLNRILLERALPDYVSRANPDPCYPHLTLVDDYDRAERTFAKLEELLTKQDQLRSSLSNIPPDTYKLELDKTDAAISAYRESFLGMSAEENWEGIFKFKPQNDLTKQLSPVLFLLSPTKGICPERGLIKSQGVRVSDKFVDGDCSTHDADQKDRVAVWLRLDRKSEEDAKLRSSLAFINSNYDQTDKERGWYFRIPAVGTAVLKSGTLDPASIDGLSNTPVASIDSVEAGAKAKEAGRDDIAIAQLGVIASVPASAAGRTTQSSVVLDEATGALLNFKVSSDALLQKTLIDDAKEASDSIIDAADPLKRLQRENDILDAKKGNRDKRKALENPDSNSNSNSNQ